MCIYIYIYICISIYIYIYACVCVCVCVWNCPAVWIPVPAIGVIGALFRREIVGYKASMIPYWDSLQLEQLGLYSTRFAQSNKYNRCLDIPALWECAVHGRAIAANVGRVWS
jgi:hypothetical protein